MNTFSNVIAALCIVVIISAEGWRWHIDSVTAARISAVQEYMQTIEPPQVLICPKKK
jgi:hypothetical protein